MIDPHQPDYSNTPASRARSLFSYQPKAPSSPPAVTIVTPFFNPGAVFHETATSVFRQSLQQWEWVIVDDCSSDPESLRILNGYREADPRIRVFRTGSQSGPAVARNLGVRMAHAPFIAFLDSDDLFEPTALEKLRWFLEYNPQYAFARGYSVGFGARNYLWTEGFHNGNKVIEANPISITGMIRRGVYLEVGGMCEEIRGGLEDWDFWLKCADRGHWGETVREYLDWYRRRENHGDRWTDWDGSGNQRLFRESLSLKYPTLWSNGVPKIPPTGDVAYPVLEAPPPFENKVGKREGVKRLLMIVPHLELGGADKFNLDLIQCLQESHGYEVTVVTTRAGTHPWRHCFEQLTPDVFTLDTFLPLAAYPTFIAYLIRSRDPDAVLITSSEMGYQLVPFLRAECPGPAFLDYIHMEQDDWRSGNYPRYSLNYSPYLDLTAVSSQHLKKWMVERGGNPARIHVCTINVDPELWNRANYQPAPLRAKYGVADGVPVIAFAGRLCDQKQPDVLAAVIKALRDRGAEFVCLVAGDGEHRSSLEEFIRANDLRELRLLGARTNEEIREILAISDICFMPSKMEGIALVLFEAMAMGVVPVGADVGGQAELVSPDCGVLIERDVHEVLVYTEALVRLLADTERRASMALACRKRICERFTLREMAATMARLLEEAAGAGELDFAAAFKAWRFTLAAEVVEQTRCEKVANDLWRQRISECARKLPEVAAEGPAVPPDAPPQPGAPVTPMAVKRRGVGVSGFLFTMLLLFSPRRFRLKLRNLNLLRKVLSDRTARSRLANGFDADFYIEQHEDLKRRRVTPLLHYAIQGYLEQRRPSPDFDVAGVLHRHPSIAASQINPLLWVALHDRN